MHLRDGIGLWAEIRTAQPAEPRPILFLDRDGVLIEDLGYVGDAATTRLYPDAADAIATARARGYRVALVTNQSGIGRGLYDWTGFASVQDIIDAAVHGCGARFDAILACAYHAEGRTPYDVADHPWRKPAPGMILEGLRLLNGIPSRSALVGDRAIDIEAARAAGLGTAVLIDRSGLLSTDATGADAVVTSLGEAIAFLPDAKTRTSW